MLIGSYVRVAMRIRERKLTSPSAYHGRCLLRSWDLIFSEKEVSMSFDSQTLFLQERVAILRYGGMNDIARKILLVTDFTPQYTRPI
jgi:hypothetical protein